MGVHKPAYFITLSGAVNNSTSDSTSSPTPLLISESSIDVFKQGFEDVTGNDPDQSAPWNLNISLAVHSAIGIPSPTLTLSIAELNLTSDPIILDSIPALSSSSGTTLTPTWLIANWNDLVERWYPHNLGSPKLYNLTLTMDLAVDGLEKISMNTPVGFRTIVLKQTRYPDSEVATRGITPGDEWHFEINGQAFYALGTNIIPFDPFYARITDEQVRWVLESAVASGQNMVGGPQPQSVSIS